MRFNAKYKLPAGCIFALLLLVCFFQTRISSAADESATKQEVEKPVESPAPNDKDPQAEPEKKPEAPPEFSETFLRGLREKLILEFDEYLKDPKEYQKAVSTKCRIFPEGDLFPYIYPAMAYVNVALRDPSKKEHCVLQAQKLLDLAVEATTKKLKPRGGKLENLATYEGQGTYLGQLNLALGAYALISQDGRYDVLNAKLSDLLHNALEKSQCKPLKSFPTLSWTFDTIPVIVSLKLYDAKTGKNRSEQVIKNHLEWSQNKATHKAFGLPFNTMVDNGKGRDPRGCDLSLRLCLLPHLDRKLSENLYAQYAKHYWLDKTVLAGFAEWPNGENHGQDMDSGPIFQGIGLGATGLGVGATIANNDKTRLQRLCGQMSTLDAMRPLFDMAQKNSVGPLKQLKLDKKHFSGFLFGDAMLFYCVTWAEWSTEKKDENAPAEKK